MFRRALVPGRQICCALPSFTERGPTVRLQSKRFKGDSRPDQVSEKFDLDGRVFAITGGARGLGLAMAEGLLGAGGEVHCLDRLEEPHEEFRAAQERSKEWSSGSLRYWQVDVCDTKAMEQTMSQIAGDKNRLDGVIAAAGVNHLGSAMDHTEEDIKRVLRINYMGAFHTATTAAKEMALRNSPGSILLVASMSGLIANKGMLSPVYNSSKAAVIQLARSLAMEWGRTDAERRCPIRVNSLCPGHIATPMAQMVMDESPDTKAIWESENMLGRLAEPHEFAGAAVFLLGDASSFLTGSTVVIDGGHTAW